MNANRIPCFCVLVIFLCILVPGVQAITPLWIAKASPSSEITSVKISTDGSTIVGGGGQVLVVSGDGTRLWGAYAGSAVDVSGDGKYIIASQGSEVRFFSRAGQSLWGKSFIGPVSDVSVSPDGSVAAAGGANVIQSWRTNGSDLGKTTTDTIWHIRVSPADDQVVMTTNAGVRSFYPNLSPRWQDNQISPDLIAISGDGSGIVTSYRNRISHYNSSGGLTWEYTIPWGNIMALAISGDGSTVVLGTDDFTIAAINADGKALWNTKAGYWVQSVAVSDSGSIVAAGSMDKKLYIFTKDGKSLGTFMVGDMIQKSMVDVSGDGSRVVVADSSKIYAFDTSNLNPPEKMTAPVETTGTGTPGPTAVPTNPVTVAPEISGTPASSTQEQTTAVTQEITTAITTMQTVITPAVATTTPKSGLPQVIVLLALALLGILRLKRQE